MTVYQRDEHDPVVEIDEKPFIDVKYLIRGLRDIQNYRYATPEFEREYVCIENAINYIESTTGFFLRGGL